MRVTYTREPATMKVLRKSVSQALESGSRETLVRCYRKLRAYQVGALGLDDRQVMALIQLLD